MIANNPKVSVVMSVKNGEKTIEDSINSILNQDYKNIELLVIDDNSEDNTYIKLKKFELFESRLKIYKNEKNIGLTKSLNFLIKKSTGDLIARQDADDISVHNRLSKQVDYMFKFNLDAVTSRSFTRETNNKIPGFSYYLPLKLVIKYKNPFIHGTLLIKKDILFKLGLYNEDFYYAQDFKLYLDLIKNGFKIKSINEFLYYLNTKNNISTKNKNQQKYYFECARKNIVPNALF